MATKVTVETICDVCLQGDVEAPAARHQVSLDHRKGGIDLCADHLAQLAGIVKIAMAPRLRLTA